MLEFNNHMENIPSSKKKVITILIVLLVVVSTAIASGIWYQKKQAQKKQAQIEEAARLKKQQYDEAMKKEVSIGYAIITQAIKAKDPNLCLELAKDVMDSCFYSVAQVTSDKAICERITDAAKKNVCQEFLIFRAGQNNVSKEFCSTFKDKEIADGCFSQIFSGFDNTKSCGDFTDLRKQRCLDLVNIKLAIKGDGSTCSLIQDNEMKGSCQVASASTPKDSDKDGLSDTTEISYGTDPFKADTDNDGLNDGDEVQKYKTNPMKADTDSDGAKDGAEVKAGTNPLGEGKLK